MIPNFISFEDANLYIPQEHKSKFQKIDWADQMFTTFSICSSSMEEYEISEDEIFLKLDGGIEKQDYTGDIEFSTVIPNEKDEIDYEIIFKALYFKGELKELGFYKVLNHDQQDRKESQKKIIKIIEEQETKKKSIFWRLYKAYCGVVDFVFTVFRYIFASLIKILWFIQNKIT